MLSVILQSSDASVGLSRYAATYSAIGWDVLNVTTSSTGAAAKNDDMFAAGWLHVGGTVAIKEHKLYPPGSYFLDSTGPTSWDAHNGAGQNCSLDIRVPDRQCTPGADPKVCEGCTHSTGETCGQAFWIKLSQRLHRLRPSNETYVRLRTLVSKAADT